MSVTNEIGLRIADTHIVASTDQKELCLKSSPSHRLFQVDNGRPDISLSYHYGSLPSIPQGELIFASGGPWSLYKLGRQNIITLVSPLTGPIPYRVAIMDESMRKGDIFIRPDESGPLISPSSGSSEAQITEDPFAYPLDELIMVNFLARGNGVILHACGVVDQGQGLLFVGVSGAGKSTIAELWKKTDVTLLSDDRIIVRRKEGHVRMYGTPWHGDACISSPESAPLEKLYFLEQAPRNYVRALSPVDAAARMLVRSFPPFYDRDGMEFTLELLTQMAAEVPSYEFGFVPDASVIDFVRGLK